MVFGIDETSLSNYEALAADDFGRIISGPCNLPQDPFGLENWDQLARSTVIPPTMVVFNTARDRGVAVFFITGRLRPPISSMLFVATTPIGPRLASSPTSRPPCPASAPSIADLEVGCSSGPRASMHSYVPNLRKLLGGIGLEAPHGSRERTARIPGECPGALGASDVRVEKYAGVQAAAAGRFEEASRHLSAALGRVRGSVVDDLRDFQLVDAFATALVERQDAGPHRTR